MPFPDIAVPTLLLDEDICRRNIARMSAKARLNGVRFRPHMKTHQSRRVASLFREEGVTAVTVSSLRMARYFAGDGWDDITVAFPVNLREAGEINRLAAEVRLHLLVEAPAVVRQLDDVLDHPAGIFVKIDTGYGRTGVPHDDAGRVDEVVREIAHSSRLAFDGILTHGGDSYSARTPDEIRARFSTSRERMVETSRPLRSSFPEMICSVGDTPGCSLAENFTGIDEIRPGNFVFYDAMQLQLGACTAADIAAAAACPIVALHPERGEALFYGGAVHLSKDALRNRDGEQYYGLAALLTDDGWSEPLPDTHVTMLSQEHGVLRTTAEILSLLREGMLIAILPVHSCLTAECMRGYLTLDGHVADHMAGRPFSLSQA